MTKPFFKDDYATIALDDAVPCIQLTLTGMPRHSEHYQLVQQKRLELMKEEIKNYPKLHMLTDSRTAGPVLEEDVDYFKNYVLPEMERDGVRYLAIVMPSNKFTQLTIRDMTQDSRVMTVKYFDALTDARKWLKKMTRA
jgi:hypothetical protein